MSFLYYIIQINVDDDLGGPKPSSKQSIGAVEPGAEELFETCLKVPPLPPSCKGGGEMEIRVSYSLLFCVRIESICFHTVLKNLIFSQDETNSLFCSV